MGWFQRLRQGIVTDTKDKKDTKEGLWHKCPECKKIIATQDHVRNYYVCEDCSYHDRINAAEYFDIIFDDGEFIEIAKELSPADPLHFEDTKKYVDRIKATQKATGTQEAMTAGFGKVEGMKLAICAFNFNFIGGSMGAVVGEKISRTIDHCIATQTPLMIISKSGGARMMEAAFSLMQMAKTSAKLTLLSDAKIPYFSFLTDPTTGGVTASFAMLGDINFAEPNALIGFAGPRVIKETIKRDLPDGFQRSEFLQEHGFLDFIVHRKELKDTLAQQLKFYAS